WYRLGVVCLEVGDLEGYRRACRAMLERSDRPDNPSIAERTAKNCLLVPDAAHTFPAALQLAERALTGTEKHEDYPWFLLAGGLADYRAGRLPQAVERLQQSLARGRNFIALDVMANLFLGMAYQRLGEAVQARRALDQARATWAQKYQAREGDEPLGKGWDD